MTQEEMVGALAVGAKQIESVLEVKFGAAGRGLHTKALSLEGHLGAALVRKIQYVATIRNKAMHEGDFRDVPLAAWTRAKDQVLAALDALDPPEPGATPTSLPVLRSPGRQAPRIGRILGGAFVFFMFAAFGISILFNRSSQEANASRSSASSPTAETPPPWSIDHPAHASQVFPWREEQAAFVAAGETGPLPAETVWRVTTPARPVQRKGVPVLAMGIELGGGHTQGKVFFKTHDTFGRLGVETYGFDVELATKSPAPKGITGKTMGPGGRWMRDKAFDCRREVPGGCGDWHDHGVHFIALSTVSFANALKTADIP